MVAADLNLKSAERVAKSIKDAGGTSDAVKADVGDPASVDKPVPEVVT